MPKPFQIALDHQNQGRWAEAAAAYAASLQSDSGEKPHVRGYPRRGDLFDQWHRLAFSQRMAGDPDGALQSYRAGAGLDPAISAWVERFAQALPAMCEDEHAARLWALVTRPESLGSQAAALALIHDTPDPCVFPDAWWSMAYTYLYQAGWPTAAYAAKAIAARVLHATLEQRRPASASLAMDMARAIAETGDYAAAATYLQSLLDDDSFTADDEARALGDLRNGMDLLAACSQRDAADGNISGRRPRALDSADDAFRALVQGRDIAIVAPADTGARQGTEIDGFDLVVRTNFRDHALIAERAGVIGSRTDISYYNGNFEPEHRDRIAASLQDKPLRYLVLRYDDAEALSRYRPLLPVRVTRIASPFYRMNSYAIPKIVFDLLHFSPRRIKVFNADFFLGPQAHYPGYIDYSIKRVQSFLQHDVLRNFRMMQVLHQAGAIEADPVLANLLSMQEPEILARIETRVAEALPSERPVRR